MKRLERAFSSIVMEEALPQRVRHLALADANQSSASGSSSSQTSPNGSSHAALLELPFLARVERLTDRGFGFASCDGIADDIFFHVASAVNGNGDFTGLKEGDFLACQIGSRPKEPNRQCIVRWFQLQSDAIAPAGGEPCQADLERLRGVMLSELQRGELHKQLRADWYRKAWNGAPPKDLQDTVLAKALCNSYASSPAHVLKRANLASRIGDWPFSFAAGLDLDDPQIALTGLLSTFSPAQLAAFGQPRREWMSAKWPAKQVIWRPVATNSRSARELSELQKAALVEWYLLATAEGEDHREDGAWLPGTQVFEATLAGKLLAQTEIPLARLEPWAVRLADRDFLAPEQVELLAQSSCRAAASLFPRLGAETQEKLLATWREDPNELLDVLIDRPELAPEIAFQCALSVDLETDGNLIREIGCARGRHAECLFGLEEGDDFAASLAAIDTRIAEANFLVGQNILAWDWPILASKLTGRPAPLIWDTLLVQYLLDPTAGSYALGGTHKASEDAEATLALFRQQLTELPPVISARLIIGHFNDTEDLFAAIIEEVIATGKMLGRTAPGYLADGDRLRLLLMPQDRLTDLDWVPSVCVVEADTATPLAIAFQEVDLDRLRAELPATVSQTPACMVLLATLERAQTAGIAVRQNMIPLWLKDHVQGLAEALAKASHIPEREGYIQVAAVPQSSAFWADCNVADFRAMLPKDEALITGRRIGVLEAGADSRIPRPRVLQCVQDGVVTRWTYPDQPAKRLDPKGGWRSFEVRRAPPGLVRVAEARPAGKAVTPPMLIRRAHQTMFPSSANQAAYWRGLFQDLPALRQKGKVPILLIGSTVSRAMLEILRNAAIGIGLAETRPDHRSRREHLRSAAKKELIIIDTIENWRDWQALATDCNLALLPLIEAAPIEEWFALGHADMTAQASKAASEMQPSVPVREPAPVNFTEAALLEALPNLAAKYMGAWLDRLELSSASPVLMDARLEAVAFEIRSLVALEEIASTPLEEEVKATLAVCLSPFEIERQEAPSGFADMERFLVENWQPPGAEGNRITGFKPTQTTAMQAIAGRGTDVMVSLPTGEGKSVLFQVPALCRGLRNRRLTLVLSPLKALMRDQVERLHDQGFSESVDLINSDRPPFELSEVMQGVLDNRIIVLYVAPERLRNAKFLDVLARRIEEDGGLEYVVFDEAHCVNQWGYEFRPDYFFAFSQLLHALRGRGAETGGLALAPTPFLLLSATLTASDRQGLRGILDRGSMGTGKLSLQICPDPNRIDNPLRDHIHVNPVQMRGDLLVRDGFEPALLERLPQLAEAIAAARANEARTGQRSAVLIFVSRRAHADDLAQRLSQQLSVEVESYHAGIDAAAREDLYHRFRDGDLKYLVATKAFGMGMDIPDIHWVVHLSSPAYLEDYLQEVGRIGRGVKERQRAGLNSLSAVLLSSPMDFERMRTLRAENALSPNDIDPIEAKIIENSELSQGKTISLVPLHGFEPYKNPEEMRRNTTKLGLALFWLEKAGHLLQLGKIANTVNAELNLAQLKMIGRDKSQAGAAARAILKDIRLETPRAGNGRQRLIETVGDFDEDRFSVALLDAFRKRAAKAMGGGDGAKVSAASPVNAVLNLQQIRKEAALQGLDQAMSVLAELQKRGGLTLIWKLEFAKRKMIDDGPEIIDAVRTAVGDCAQAILHRLRGTGTCEFDPKELLHDNTLSLSADPNGTETDNRQIEARSKRMHRAWINGFRSLLRNSGVKLRQIVDKSDTTIRWKADLPTETNRDAIATCQLILTLAPPLMELITSAIERKENSIDIYRLIRIMQDAHPNHEFSRNTLYAVLRLLSSMNLVSAQPELVPLSYVLLLTGHPPGFHQYPELVGELADVNEMARLRGEAMEVFCHLPESVRGDFITGYFSQQNAAGMKSFLSERLEEHEEREDSFFRTKLIALRATQIGAFFKKYQNSEEAAQWAAISHPYHKHLLVNAGPGAGKTSVLVGRITHLIHEQGLKPSEIMVLAFNRAVVSEIKQRLRELFRSLGLSSFAARLRVSTFHGLATQHMAQALRDGTVEQDGVLRDFAAKLSREPDFRNSVAGSCRAVLLDEFQDMSEDIWSVIQNLHDGTGGRAGVMAIGDDDQDILRWQRKAQPFFAEGYFDLFRSRFGAGDLTELELKVNFRSGPEIVSLSQKMIGRVFANNQASRRLKIAELRAAETAEPAQIERLNATDLTWEQMLQTVLDRCLGSRADHAGTLAILCRTNEEVASLQQFLVPHLAGIRVQGEVNLRLSSLRHVGLWLDYLDAQISVDDLPLSESTRKELFATFTQTAVCPASDLQDGATVSLQVLWDLCLAEIGFPHLSSLAAFIRDLQQDEYLRLTGNKGGGEQIVLSTIHKVKGLEFDTVIVIPSRSDFGKDRRGTKAQPEIDADAIEEARLYYVALTRAKSKLIYLVGPRENAWSRARRDKFDGDKGSGKVLAGSPKEVAIGWSMQQNGFHTDVDATQTYIERNVRIGDRVYLGGRGAGAFRALLHRDGDQGLRQIGFLAKAVDSGDQAADMKVSAIMRYPIEDMDLAATSEQISKRGWGYIVTVAGRLRS